MIKINPKWNTLEASQRLYHMPVPIIGLTGGIASGKSSVSRLLRAQGIRIIDADALVKQVYQTERAIKGIEALAPDAVVNGSVDFKKLRPLFFSSNELQAQVEKLIYAGMPEVFKSAFENDINNHQDFIIYDVPLLFEKDLARRVDTKVCVYCDQRTQIERLLKRDSIDLELANKMLARQWDIEKKRSDSDLVIDNSKTETALESAVKLFLSELLAN